MYNEELEQLITIALEDGVLTEKEKQVLYKKAQSLGIDRDEFEMVLNSRLAKARREKEAIETIPTQKGTISKTKGRSRRRYSDDDFDMNIDDDSFDVKEFRRGRFFERENVSILPIVLAILCIIAIVLEVIFLEYWAIPTGILTMIGTYYLKGFLEETTIFEIAYWVIMLSLIVVQAFFWEWWAIASGIGTIVVAIFLWRILEDFFDLD